MKKPPIPTFTAAYPAPSVDRSYIFVAVLIASLVALYFYVDYQIKQDAEKSKL